MRESVLLAWTSRGQSELAGWVSLYEAEGAWLDAALDKAGLATVREIFAGTCS